MSVPIPSSARVRAQMRSQVRRDTACEIALRRALFARGLRYRVNVRPLPQLRREADVVFRQAKVAVFVDGCFWHACPIHKAPVRRNASWWRDKLARTVARDRATNDALVAAGWTVIRVWEHTDPKSAAEAVYALLEQRRDPAVHRL